jgi:hypothetical protein
MLRFLHGKASDRKLRLFACACIRGERMSDLLSEQSLNAVMAAKLYADGLLGPEAFKAINTSVWDGSFDGSFGRRSAAESWANSAAALATSANAAEAAVGVVRALTQLAEIPVDSAKVLREVVNPFYEAMRDEWPSTVVQLAESLYAGQDCAFALHDALLEAGHAELAEHFREEKSHPKGCWVVDLILGKE